MEKEAILKIAKSIVIVFLVSIIFSLFLTSFNVNLFLSFATITLVQFLFFYFYGEYRKNKSLKLLLQTEIDISKEKNKQFATVTCPCDRKLNTVVPININGSNSYSCQGCNKLISIFIETKTALSTQPITHNPLEAPILVEEINKIVNDNKRS